MVAGIAKGMVLCLSWCCTWWLCERLLGCRIADDSALERAKGRAARPFLEAADPWLTEARVVAAHGGLHKAQVRSLRAPWGE